MDRWQDEGRTRKAGGKEGVREEREEREEVGSQVRDSCPRVMVHSVTDVPSKAGSPENGVDI